MRLAANTVTATAPAGNTVFTFPLDATTGAWTFTLVRPLDHPTLDGLAGDNDENDLTINSRCDRCRRPTLTATR